MRSPGCRSACSSCGRATGTPSARPTGCTGVKTRMRTFVSVGPIPRAPRTGCHPVSLSRQRCKVDVRLDLGKRIAQRVYLLAVVIKGEQVGLDDAKRFHWGRLQQSSGRRNFAKGGRAQVFRGATLSVVALWWCKLWRFLLGFLIELPCCSHKQSFSGASGSSWLICFLFPVIAHDSKSSKLRDCWAYQ